MRIGLGLGVGRVRGRVKAVAAGGASSILGAWGTPGTTGVVSGNDFSVSGNQAHGSARVGPGHTSGKYTCEFEIILKGGAGVTKPQIGFGLADSTVTMSGYLGSNAKSGMFWLETDGVFVSGVTDAAGGVNGGTTTVGDKFQVHLDIDNGKVWIAKNGTLLGTASPNPVAGTGPYITFTPGGFTWSIAATCMALNGDTKVRLATTLSSAAPTGYTAMLGA